MLDPKTIWRRRTIEISQSSRDGTGRDQSRRVEKEMGTHGVSSSLEISRLKNESTCLSSELEKHRPESEQESTVASDREEK